jgi:2-C-methyl-D-erythritol 4-phosphate cytidylyltransferase
MSATNCSAIIVAAGQGTRLGLGVPKAFVNLGGEPLFLHSLRIFRCHPTVRHVVVVAPPDRVPDVAAMIESSEGDAPFSVVAGGAQRWESARNGVSATPESVEWVMIHDAARPFVTNEVIDSLISCASSHKAAFTATREVDTIREIDGDHAGRTLDRSRLLRVGTPQLFHRATLLAAFDHGQHMSPPPTDEIMLMEREGLQVGVAWGDPLNFKITTEEDLYLAEAIIAKRQAL